MNQHTGANSALKYSIWAGILKKTSVKLCKTATLKTYYRLMQVNSIAECSNGSILQQASR